MKTNDLKITLAQLNSTIGDFEGMFQNVSKTMSVAESSGADIVVFPELFMTGYPPLDRLEQEDFLKKVVLFLEKLKSLTSKTAIIIGSPEKNLCGRGKPLFNSAFFISDGKIIHSARKGLIPNYDVFDEYRYFEPADEFRIVEFRGNRIALTICEDLWDKSGALEYKVHPMDILLTQNPDCIINIAASPFDYLKYQTRKNILIRKAKETKLPLFYVNNIGAQSELIFDGGSMAISPQGEVCGQMKFFEEDCKTFSLKDITTNQNPLKDIDIPAVEKIYQALQLGLKDYFSKSGFKKAVIGLSGGVDSALVAVLAVHALGNDNVQALFIPTAYSSEESFNDARLLASNLSMPFETVSIESSFRHVLEVLHPLFAHQKEDITEENIQSRLRGLMLMSYSNKFGNILLNTSNKSEMATGYGTLYGDMCGSLSVIGDLYKTQVYELCHYINRDIEIIPENILTKAPTAELKPGQKDSDSLPEYALLDTVLFHYLELGSPFDSISSMPEVGEKLAKKIIELVDKNEFKRFQAPPVLRVSTKAFGMGRRFPLVGKNN